MACHGQDGVVKPTLNIMLTKLSQKIGIKEELFHGYMGLILFSLGMGIEISWFSSFLEGDGFNLKFISLIFSLYGFATFIFSYLSSFMVNKFSGGKIMFAGVVVYLLSASLLIIGIMYREYNLIAFSYFLRGASFPLFANSFLVLITLKTDLKHLGKATAYFFLCSNLGMNIIAPVLSSNLLSSLSAIDIFMIGAVISVFGGIIALGFSKKDIFIGKKDEKILANIATGITILFKNKRLIAAVVVLIINNMGRFGFIIIMPIFLLQRGFSLEQWGSIWAITYIVNSLAGIGFGHLGDKYGLRKIAMYFSGTITALSCVLIYIFCQYFYGNVFLLGLAFSIFAIGIAAFGPISALIPAMLSDNKPIAVSIINLGSGLSGFVGSLFAGAIFEKFGGNVLLISLAIIYLFASLLISVLKTKEELV